MQPRNRFSPYFCSTFHVTKSGCSPKLACASFRDLFPKDEKKLLLLELLLVALLASLIRLGVELALCTEDELAVKGEGARSRDIAAGL